MLNNEYEGKFCCPSMDSAQRDCRWMIDYDPDTKSHFMVMVWPGSDQFHFNYCPWCAKSIRSVWLDEIEKPE